MEDHITLQLLNLLSSMGLPFKTETDVLGNINITVFDHKMNPILKIRIQREPQPN